jgi:hypothetical protein
MSRLSQIIAVFRIGSVVGWIKSHKGGAVASLTFTVSVSLALFFGFSGLREPQSALSYEILKEIDVLDVRTPVEELSVTFQGEDIQGGNLNLRIYAMKVTNTGEVDILKSQFDEDLPWGLRLDGGRAIEARVIDSSSTYLFETIKPRIIADDSVEFPKAILEKGQFFAFNMLVLHGKEQTPGIVPLGKIAGINEIGLTKVPVKVEGPGFSASLFVGGWEVQAVRVIIFLIGSALVFLLGALTATYYFSLRESMRRRRIQNSVVMNGRMNEQQQQMLTDIYSRQGADGIRELLAGVNNPMGLPSQSALATVYGAANGGELVLQSLSPTVEALEAVGALTRGEGDAVTLDPNFEQSLEMLVLELGSSPPFLT